MTRAKLSWWGICVLVATGAAVAGGCSGTGSGGDNGRVLGGPGQNGTDPASGPAATPGSTLFAVTYGGTGSEGLVGIATDAVGNFYVAGSQSEQTADPSTGSADNVFIIKYSPSGELLWKQLIPFGGTNQLQVAGIAVQPTTGAVIITGSFFGTVNVGGGPMTSGIRPLSNGATIASPAPNVFLAAFDTAGYFVWSRSYLSNQLVFPTQLFIAGNGDIELFGGGDNNSTVGGGPLCCRAGDFNGPISFVARYSPVGDPSWSNVIGGDFFSDGAGADADGGMVVGGVTNGTMTYQGESVSAGGSSPDGTLVDVGTVLRIDGQGHKTWLNTYPGTAPFARFGAALDPSRDVVLFGNFGGTLDFGNGVTLAGPAEDVAALGAGLLAKLDPGGVAQWAKQFPPTGQNSVFPDTIAIDSAGNIALAGEDEGGGSVGGATLLPADTRGEFVAKFAPDGSHLWSHGYPIEHGFGSVSKRALSFAPDGALGFGGGFHNTIDFGTGPITVPGVRQEARGGAPLPPDDMFLIKLAP